MKYSNTDNRIHQDHERKAKVIQLQEISFFNSPLD